jgi:lysophospholipase L1-like esterase
MDSIKGRMTSLVLIFLLLLISATAGMVVVNTYKDFYKRNALLRIDPLEIASVDTDGLTATLQDSEIWMIGDSRMRRWPVELLKSSTTVANLGVEGQTSSQVMLRFKSYLETATPSLVILEVGINDLKIIGLDDKFANSITHQYYRNIEEMIQLCRVRNTRIILVSIFSVGKIELSRRLVWNASVNDAIRAANRKLASYCDENVIYCFDANSILSVNGLTVRPEYQDDFLHINARGYEVLSSNLEVLINKIINHN